MQATSDPYRILNASAYSCSHLKVPLCHHTPVQLLHEEIGRLAKSVHTFFIRISDPKGNLKAVAYSASCACCAGNNEEMEAAAEWASVHSLRSSTSMYCRLKAAACYGFHVQIAPEGLG